MATTFRRQRKIGAQSGANYFKAIVAWRARRQIRIRDYYTNRNILGEEAADKEDVGGFFMVIDGLHANFYDDYMSAEQVVGSIEDIKKLIAISDKIKAAAN